MCIMMVPGAEQNLIFSPPQIKLILDQEDLKNTNKLFHHQKEKAVKDSVG